MSRLARLFKAFSGLFDVKYMTHVDCMACYGSQYIFIWPEWELELRNGEVPVEASPDSCSSGAAPIELIPLKTMAE